VARSLQALQPPPDTKNIRVIKRALKTIDPGELSLMLAGSLLNAIVSPTGDESAPRTTILRNVGRMIKRLGRQGRAKGLFAAWDNETTIRAGGWLVNCCLNAIPDVFVLNGDVPCIVGETVDAADALVKQLTAPVFNPQTEPPEPWTRWSQGLRQLVRDDRAEGRVRRALRNGTMQSALDGLNALQAVPWETNPPIIDKARALAVCGELPQSDRKPGETKWDYETRLRQDNARALVAAATGSTLHRFYTPMSLEWRGRVYADTHYAYQREDLVRAQFRFANGLPLNEAHGNLQWLKVHLANTWGGDGISKRPFDDRVRYVDQNLEQIKANWRDADDPLQCLAACIELEQALSTPGCITKLPVALDATASGLQHLCAMIGSEDGAKVNLTYSKEPRDIYALVAARVETALRASSDQHAEACLKWGIDRKLLKAPVMTYGYSVTPRGVANQLISELTRRHSKWNYPAVNFLAELILVSIEGETPGAAEMKKFLRDVVERLNEIGKPLRWTSPVGLPIVNSYYKPRNKRIEIPLLGVRHSLKVAVGDTAKINPQRALNGVVPNIVHAMDASLVLMTAAACAAEGIELATVHDSFATLAPNWLRLNRIVREQFVKLYTEHDVLAEIYESAARDGAKNLPDPPKRGSLDVNAVLESPYFLS
jgi:DNA-directed RNA polymerase